MRKKVAYIRTSTSDQSGEAQRYALRQATTARGWENVEEFADIGVSGARANRPALDRLRRAARAGEVEAVMVAALDRLGRSLPDLLHLLDELVAAGVAVISLREAIDLSTPAGKFMTQMLGALAEFERALIRERVKAGIARVKATGITRSGKPLGRPRREVNVEAALALRAQGKSWRDVAQALRVPRRTLLRAVTGAKTHQKSEPEDPRDHAA